MSDEAEVMGLDMANRLEMFVNNFSRQPQEACIARLLQMHPTLQQNMGRFFLSFFAGMAKKDYGDLRNQALRELSQEIMKLPENKRALPLI